MIHEKIVSIASDIFGVATEQMKKQVVETPRADFGDFTITALMQNEFKARKDELFETLKNKLSKEKGIRNVKLDGLFVNIFLDPIFVVSQKEELDKKQKKVMLEYPSPNSNKPLHLGHLRNIVLGDALSGILSKKNIIVHANLVNDRGIHICKSMLGYEMFSEFKSPEEAKMKPDHFVGYCYVLYANAEKEKPELEEKAQEMLQKWENGDPVTLLLWKKMNKWAFAGMNETYKQIGMRKVDVLFLESRIYKKGKKIVLDAYKKGIVKKDENGNYIVSLEKYKLPDKVVLRQDRTSIYITQDIFLANYKLEKYGVDDSIYVVGSEQNDYFKQLFCVVKELTESGKGMEHFSYGMISLPEGKMKSREGTVVDADDLVLDLEKTIEPIIKEKWSKISDKELGRRKRVIALAAIKYFILKYDPKKDFVFNKETSLSFEGNSGPYLLYSYARINSLLRNAQTKKILPAKELQNGLSKEEENLLRIVAKFDFKLNYAYERHEPHVLVTYITDLSNQFNSYYAQQQIITTNNEETEQRLLMLVKLKEIYERVFKLLNIPYLEKM